MSWEHHIVLSKCHLRLDSQVNALYVILIPGMSATARKRKEEVAQALKKVIQAKGKTPAMKYQQLLDDLRGQSETVNI